MIYHTHNVSCKTAVRQDRREREREDLYLLGECPAGCSEAADGPRGRRAREGAAGAARGARSDARVDTAAPHCHRRAAELRFRPHTVEWSLCSHILSLSLSLSLTLRGKLRNEVFHYETEFHARLGFNCACALCREICFVPILGTGVWE